MELRLHAGIPLERGDAAEEEEEEEVENEDEEEEEEAVMVVAEEEEEQTLSLLGNKVQESIRVAVLQGSRRFANGGGARRVAARQTGEAGTSSLRMAKTLSLRTLRYEATPRSCGRAPPCPVSCKNLRRLRSTAKGLLQCWPRL